MFDTLPQMAVNALLLAFTYALIALGFATIYGTTRVFHFAHGSVYAAAAYAVYFVDRVLGLPFPFAAAVAIVVAVAFGWAIDRWGYEPLIARGASQLSVFVTSLGIFTIADSVVSLPFGRSPIAVPNDFLPIAPIEVAGVYVTPAQLLLVAVACLLLGLVPVFLVKTRVGVAIRALASDPYLAEVVGVDVRGTRLAVFALGSALAGAAASLTTLTTGVIDPTMNLSALLSATIAVIIGGVGSLLGSVVGAVLLATFETIASGYLSSEWAELIAFALVLVVIMIRPRGVMGRKLSRLGG